jgi:hypothetical protein
MMQHQHKPFRSLQISFHLEPIIQESSANPPIVVPAVNPPDQAFCIKNKGKWMKLLSFEYTINQLIE